MRKSVRWFMVPMLLVLGLGTVPASADHNADQHSPNMQHLFNSPQGTYTNSDLAFWGDRLYAGNYGGFRIFDISTPQSPVLVTDFSCEGSQNDISVWNNDGDPEADLLFLSVDAPRVSGLAGPPATFNPTGNPAACAGTRSASSSSPDEMAAAWEGVRIIDINDETAPSPIAHVPTDCGSHTHTLVPSETNDVLHVYVSSYPTSGHTNDVDFLEGGARGPQGVARPAADRPEGRRNNGTDCHEPEPRPDSATGDWIGNEAHNKISIITVDLSAPADADNTTIRTESATEPCPGVKADTCLVYPAVTEVPLPLATRVTHLQGGTRTLEFTGCHDIAVFMGINTAAGACWDEGIIWDISDPAAPEFQRRIRNDAVDTLFHSATFTWDGKTIAFEDEAGGGGDDRCNDPNDPQGRMWFYDLSARALGSFKIPRPQGEDDICTAHNYNVVPQTNGRDILTSAWYEGGTSMIDFSNPTNASEIGFYDAQTPPATADTWSSYWYNGYVYANDITRGLDVFAFNDPLVEGAVDLPFFNPQTQMDLIPQVPPRCAGVEATIFGTSAADVLVGTGGRDVIVGGGGHDRITALGGRDIVCAGGGRDKVSGAGGKDLLRGQGGKDNLRGGKGNDRLVGGGGRDRCHGGPGRNKAVKCEKEVQIP